ncbi:MAG: hypothetical protein KC733_11925, partial [Candidatus Omnitrophica bacterium]|nr:hypothetical protein [Candidatus Omnitrophota bacterium]
MNLYRLPKKKTGLLMLLTFMALIAGLTAGLLLATQYTAYKLGYHQALGSPVIGRIYNPFYFLKWHFTFGQISKYSHIFRNGFIILLSTITAVTGAVWITVVVLRFREKETDVHGSAHWATEQ